MPQLAEGVLRVAAIERGGKIGLRDLPRGRHQSLPPRAQLGDVGVDRRTRRAPAEGHSVAAAADVVSVVDSVNERGRGGSASRDPTQMRPSSSSRRRPKHRSNASPCHAAWFHHSSRAPGSARSVRTRPTPGWRVVGFLLGFAAVLLIIDRTCRAVRRVAMTSPCSGGRPNRGSSARGEEHQTPCRRASSLRARAISCGAVRLPSSAISLSSRADVR
jgi:hypothetical protein